jgi:hypothetical protein
MPARSVKLTVVHRNVTRRSRHRAAAGSRSSAAPIVPRALTPWPHAAPRAVAVTAVGHEGERHGIEAVAARRAIAHSVHVTWPEALTARRALDQLGQRSMRTGQRLSQHTGSTTTLACDVGLGLLDLDQLHSSTEIEPVERGRHRVMSLPERSVCSTALRARAPAFAADLGGEGLTCYPYE